MNIKLVKDDIQQLSGGNKKLEKFSSKMHTHISEKKHIKYLLQTLQG